MIDQRDLVEGNGWSDIIIFDAGRYDIFEELYLEYFEGKLHKVWNGNIGCTHDWMKRTFRCLYPDVTYYSPAPQVNDKVLHLEFRFLQVYSFDKANMAPDIHQ